MHKINHKIRYRYLFNGEVVKVVEEGLDYIVIHHNYRIDEFGNSIYDISKVLKYKILDNVIKQIN